MNIQRAGRTAGRWPKYRLIVDGVDIGLVERTLVSGGDRMAPRERYNVWRIQGTTLQTQEEAEQKLIARAIRFGYLRSVQP